MTLRDIDTPTTDVASTSVDAPSLDEEIRRAAFAYAARLGDPNFRKMLRTQGWHGGDVVVTVSREPVESAMTRALKTTTPPVLVALWRNERFSFLSIKPRTRWLVKLADLVGVRSALIAVENEMTTGDEY